MNKLEQSSILLGQCRAYVTIARKLLPQNKIGARAYLEQAEKCLVLILADNEMMDARENNIKELKDYRNFIGFDVNKAG